MKGNTPEPLDYARWGLALAAAGVLAGASPAVASYYAPAKLFLAALGAAWTWACLLRRPERSFRPNTPLDLPLAALGLVLVLSTFFSEDPAASVVGSYSLYAYGLLPLGLCAALYYGTVCSGQNRDPAPLLRACLLSGLAVALYGLLQKAGVDSLAGLPTYLPYGRLTSLQGNPVYLGSCLLMLLPVALHFALAGKGADRPFGGMVFLAASVTLALTLSRSAWLGAAAACGAYVVWTGRVRARWVVLGAVLLAGGLILVVRARPVTQSDSMRLHLWQSSLRIFEEDPWLGSGPDTFQSALGRAMTDGYLRTHGRLTSQNSAHNDLLQVLSTTGLAGILAYLWLLLGIARSARQALADPARRDAAAALAAGLLGLFLQAKLNAAPLASFVLAALFAGLLARRSDARLPRAASIPAALYCLAALLLSGLIYRADAAQMAAIAHADAGRHRQALNAYRRASNLNPAEPSYQLARVRLLLNLAKAAPSPDVRQSLLDEASAAARRSSAWRPASVIAQRTLAVTSLMKGDLIEAERAYDRALRLDRGLPGLLESRIKLARRRGDEAKARELESSLATVLKLTSPPAPN